MDSKLTETQPWVLGKSDGWAIKLGAAQVRQLYAQSIPGLVGAQLSSLVLVVALWKEVPHWRLFVWLGAYFIVQMMRNRLIRQFQKASPSDEEALSWGSRFSKITFASGLIWGMAGVFLFPEHSIFHQFIMALFLAGISAAAIVVYSPLKECYFPVVIAECLPLPLRCFYELDSAHLIMGSVMLVYCVVLILTGRHVHAINENSLKLRFEKDDLLKSVLSQQQESDKLNKELKTQIEQREKIQRGLAESEIRYRELAELLPQLVFELDLHGKFRFVNRAGLEMMGRTSDHLAKGLSPEEVCSAEDWERARREIGEVFDGKSVLGLEYHLTKSDGSSLPVMTYASPIMREGRIVGVRGVGVDVSELKAIQKQLMASLKEKEVLLREIHHRVKNNLQVVCSLLRVQRRSLENAQQAAMFQESENRIVSMATVYEKLYQSSNLSELNAGEYLSSLVRNIQGSYEAIGRGIELRTELEDVILNPDSAIPLGLIATELVSNCLKHAFPNPVNGRIQVSLRSVNDTRVELKVRDNGIGLPERTDAAECTSLGLRLVGIFVQQLGGELQISRDAGTAISVRFEKATMETG